VILARIFCSLLYRCLFLTLFRADDGSTANSPGSLYDYVLRWVGVLEIGQ
jgi:hypothetical protein